jgi:hypothetical protein
MSVFSVEDIDLVLSQLSQVNDEDLIAAKNDLLKPRKAGDSKNTSGMKLNEIYAIGEKLGVGDVYDKQIQDTYVEAASLYAALIRKQKGLTDDKQVFEAADALATKFLVRNVSVKEIDGDKYAIFNRQIGRINFFDEQYKHLSVLWRQERNKLARELGVDSDDLRLNMNDAVRANGELKIPVLLNDIQGFSGDVSFFSVPAERTAIKNKVDTVLERNKASQVYPARRFK